MFDHMDDKNTHNFTVGINDDVTNLSLQVKEELHVAPKDVVSCMFWGLGSDGTVGANKNSIKIIGDNTDMNAQAYFVYDSKKSGGITTSHLRFGKSSVNMPWLIEKADFVACHNPAYIGRYDMLKPVKEGGTFLLNTKVPADKAFDSLTSAEQKTIIDRKVRFFCYRRSQDSQRGGTGKPYQYSNAGLFLQDCRCTPGTGSH